LSTSPCSANELGPRQWMEVTKAEAHERSIPRLINAVTVALNLVPTSTYTSLTSSSLAFPIPHLRRQVCSSFVVSRRAATVSCTFDPIYIQPVRSTNSPNEQSASTYISAVCSVLRTSGVDRGRSVRIFRHGCGCDLSPTYRRRDKWNRSASRSRSGSRVRRGRDSGRFLDERGDGRLGDSGPGMTANAKRIWVLHVGGDFEFGVGVAEVKAHRHPQVFDGDVPWNLATALGRPPAGPFRTIARHLPVPLTHVNRNVPGCAPSPRPSNSGYVR
jgi:hypothetical protein